MKFQPLVLIAIAASYVNADIMDQLPSIQSQLAAYETIIASAYKSIQLDADGDWTKAASGYAGLTTNGWYKSYMSYVSSVASDLATVTDEGLQSLFNTLQDTDMITLSDDAMDSTATDDAMDTSATDDSSETDEAVSSEADEDSSASASASSSRSSSGSRSASASGSASGAGSASSSGSDSESSSAASDSSSAFGVVFLAPVGAVMGALALALM